MKAGTAWPWDDGNELPRVIPVIRVKGSCTFSFLRRFPYRVQRLLWQLLTHPFPSCQYADNLSWVHGVLRVLYINVSKFPRHVTAVVKVIECIFESPLHHSRAEGRQFEIVRSPPRFPLSQPRIRLTPAIKTLVGRVIAASRSPPWLLSGWGCQGRRLSRGPGNPDTRFLLWPCRR